MTDDSFKMPDAANDAWQLICTMRRDLRMIFEHVEDFQTRPPLCSGRLEALAHDADTLGRLLHRAHQATQ